MPIFLVSYVIFGLIIGSFLNVCIYRLPRHLSIVFPGSHCPSCNKPIRAYDNVPVLAYLWLGGRCRFCRERISLQYPAVELLTGLAFFACARAWGYAPATFFNSLFLSLLIVLVFVDYQHQILPNLITLPGTVVGIALCFAQDSDIYLDGLADTVAASLHPSNPAVLVPLVGSVVGALVGSGILFVVGMAYKAVRKRQGLGMGDIKMMALVGAFLGWRLALLTIFAGSLLGSLLGIFLVLFRGRNLQSKLAFGTLLGAAAAFALFFGRPLLSWYTGAP